MAALIRKKFMRIVWKHDAKLNKSGKPFLILPPKIFTLDKLIND